MKKIDFNNGWICKPLNSQGKPVCVTLPHDAMRTESRVPTSRGEGNIGWFEGGDYEYSKQFEIPDELKSEKLVLEFEGVYHNAEVMINGEKAAFRPYGYTNFYVDLSQHLKSGINEISVTAKNSDQPNSRWYSGTGIYRPVWLWHAPEDHILINGVRIETLSINPPKIRVDVKTSSPGEVAVEILKSGKPVSEIKGIPPFDIEIDDAKLWSPDTPEMYAAKVKFKDDTAEESFGIRELKWTPSEGITLNGNRYIVRGACIHHDNGILGACTYPEVEERRIRILKEAGYNAVRSAHNPCSKYLLDACDKIGMLMCDEYTDCWYMHKTQYDYASYVQEWWKEDLRDMVEKDFNHPSVFMYSTGNEVAESAQPKGIQLQRDFTDYLHSLDPTRPVTCGINIFFNFLSSAGLGVYSDEKAKQNAEAARKAAEAAEKAKKAKKPKKKHVGSEFFNSIAAKIGTDFMKFGATLPPCDTKTRDVFSAMDIAGYNYGNWRYKKDSKKYPERLILGSETLIGDAYDFWKIAKTTPQIVGDFVWAAWDYIGECGDSSPEFSDYMTDAPEDRVRGGTCRIDMTGKLTSEADYTRVAFELDKGPRIAVFPVYEKEKPTMTGWQLTRSMRSWTWPGCEGETAKIEVFARADNVELILNGKKIAKKSPKKGIVRFTAQYAPGELVAVSYDKNGKEIGRDKLVTAGNDTHMSLEEEKRECAPREHIYLRVRYTDSKGEIKPMEKHRVTISAENGEVIGAANASCSFKGNFASDTSPTYFGEMQAIVRAGSSGTVTVKASDGINTSKKEIKIICK